jgi:prevent-host-death family protein
MKIANISETKNGLSALLERVKKGDTILIVDRNTPVAQLVPIDRHTKLDDPLALIEKNVVLRRPQGALSKAFFDKPLLKASKGASALEALLEERRQGR